MTFGLAAAMAQPPNAPIGPPWPPWCPPGTANNAGGAEGTPSATPSFSPPITLPRHRSTTIHCLDSNASLGQDGYHTGRTNVTLFEELFDYSLIRVQGCCRPMYSVAPITRENGGTWPFRARSFTYAAAAHASRHLLMDPSGVPSTLRPDFKRR